MISINMTKAKEIKRDMIREERRPLLAALDIEVMKSFTDATKLAEIEAKKQKLRDATAHPSIELSETPDELKAIDIGVLCE